MSLVVPPVRVEVVRDRESLDALEPAWRQLAASDPQASVFLSWPWIRGRLEALTSPWEILVARAGGGGEITALLPLRELQTGGAWGMAGSPLADFTGLLCRPGMEGRALAALRDHFCHQPRSLDLADVHDPRIGALARTLRGSGYEIATRPGVSCPRLSLPDTWEELLATRMSPSRRATVRRKLRTFARLDPLRLTSLQDGDDPEIDAALEALLHLWQTRWGFLDPVSLAEYRSVLDHCHRDGILWLDLFWQGETPITGLLAFLDPGRSWFGFYLTGFDDRYARYSPGTVIVAHSLRRAIEAGYRTFDFLRGDEPYKRSFGATPVRGAGIHATWRPAQASASSRKLSQRVSRRAETTSG